MLASLDDRALRDAGISRAEIREVSKPFWRARVEGDRAPPPDIVSLGSKGV